MPAGMEDESLDIRMQENATTAKRRFDCLVKGSSDTVDSGYLVIYGEVKSFKFMSIDIPTDAVYQFQILDIDELIVYDRSGISDVVANQPVWVNETNDNVLQLCGMYKCRWTWVTPRVITALDYQALLIFE